MEVICLTQGRDPTRTPDTCPTHEESLRLSYDPTRRTTTVPSSPLHVRPFTDNPRRGRASSDIVRKPSCSPPSASRVTREQETPKCDLDKGSKILSKTTTRILLLLYVRCHLLRKSNKRGSLPVLEPFLRKSGERTRPSNRRGVDSLFGETSDTTTDTVSGGVATRSRTLPFPPRTSPLSLHGSEPLTVLFNYCSSSPIPVPQRYTGSVGGLSGQGSP